MWHIIRGRVTEGVVLNKNVLILVFLLVAIAAVVAGVFLKKGDNPTPQSGSSKVGNTAGALEKTRPHRSHTQGDYPFVLELGSHRRPKGRQRERCGDSLGGSGS